MRLYILGVIFLSNFVTAQIYKCVDGSGKIKYQSKECNESERSKVMTIKPAPSSVVHDEPKLKHTVPYNPLDKYKNSTERIVKKQQKEHKKKKCNTLRKLFKREEKKVKERCKRNKEIFCDLSAVRIEQNERRKAIMQIGNNSSSRRNRSSGGGIVRIPAKSPVEIVKQEMKKNGCR